MTVDPSENRYQSRWAGVRSTPSDGTAKKRPNGPSYRRQASGFKGPIIVIGPVGTGACESEVIVD